MKRSTTARRPYVRKGRTSLTGRGGPGEAGGPAARLAAMAGATARPSVEQLEPRQLLFSLTITPNDIDPFTGLGRVTAFFGYTIPYLHSRIMPGTNPATVVTENFNQPDPGMPPIAIPQAFVFQDNQVHLRIEHNITPFANFALIGNGTNNALQIRTDANQFFRFRFQDDLAIVNPTLDTVTNVQMDIGTAPVGLDLTNTVVRLLYRGQVVGTFTGAALGALNQTAPGTGAGHFSFSRPAGGPTDAFDGIEFDSTAGPNQPITVDNVSYTLTTTNLASTVESRIFGGEVVLAGPVGASVQFLDLYGRDMTRTIALGIPTNGRQPIVNPSGNGVPDFNDGIGQIIISGGDPTTALTLWGGTITTGTVMGAEFSEAGFSFTLPGDLKGLYDDFEQAGFGYILSFETTPRVVGLPPGPGSIVIGAPWIRNAANPTAYLTDPSTFSANYVNPTQGVFVRDGKSINSVYINGIVHGSSHFNGALDRFVAGYLPGSLTVDGDLGELVVGSEAGLWYRDVNIPLPPNFPGVVQATQGQLVVGRTLGQVHIAGRSLMNITVVGDLNSPATRPPRDIFRYYENEFIYAIDPATMDGIRVTIRTTLANTDFAGLDSRFPGFFFTRRAQALAFGLGSYLRNDTITSAEFVGTAATAVEIHGELGAQDPVNTGEDPSDVYAFASDGTTPVSIKLDAGAFLYYRVVDRNGRVLAATQVSDRLAQAQFLRFQPDGAGLYYLVVSSPNSPGFLVNQSYVITIGGMAPVTFGTYRTGAGFGQRDIPSQNPTITLISGSMGSMRIGTAYLDGSGMDVSPREIMNTEETNLDKLMKMRGMTVTIPGSLYNITAAGDINSDATGGNQIAQIQVGGDFGDLVTGISTLVGGGPNQGDVSGLHLEVGGRIARIDIHGNIGIDGDTMPQTLLGGVGLNTVITSGTHGGDGSIAVVRVGGNISGDTLTIHTSPGSVIGAFLVSQDFPVGDPNNPLQNLGIYGIGNGGHGVIVNTGAGSDVRFVDYPRLDLINSVDSFLPLLVGTPVTLTDDKGGQVRIQIVGGTLPAGARAGEIRVLPIDGAQGVAIGRITINLTGGAQLLITGLGPVGSTDITSIGRIIVTAATGASSINIVGNSQVDLYQITQTGGDALDSINNQTPLGDIVSVDVNGLRSLTIAKGDLGRTQVPAWGPQLIGPFVDIASGYQNMVGAAVGVPPVNINANWGGGSFVPVNRATVPAGAAFLEDLGSPVSGYINGLIVRSGNLAQVLVGGAIGDVITQGGNIALVTANSDNVTPQGRFDGIVGTIYGLTIARVDVGDGVAQRTNSPMSSSGIFADNDITLVTGQAAPGNPNPNISSTIIAANNTFDGGAVHEGLDTISLSGGGKFVNAWIGSEDLDGFWQSFEYFAVDQHQLNGDLFRLQGTDVDFLRSTIFVDNLDTFVLTNGFYDASDTHATSNILSMTASGYRNSTATGGDLEVHLNEIIVGRDVTTITTATSAGPRTGDFSDLTINIIGSVLGEISGNNFSRVDFSIANRITELLAMGSFRGSNLVGGQLDDMSVGLALQSSNITISGPIVRLAVGTIAPTNPGGPGVPPPAGPGGRILNSNISVTGASGRIDLISAEDISGSISAAGPIGTIDATGGNLTATITTTTANGNVDVLRAAGDLDIRTDVSGTINTMVAGRNIGNQATPSVILVHGNLGSVDASHGQIYSDLRIGQALTGSITIGAVVAKPGNSLLSHGSIIAFGRISNVTINGDFDGDIISYTGGIGSVSITNGSFLPGNLIAAYDGDIADVTITAGDLLGNIHADYILYSVRVVGTADGVFGSIGINPTLSQGVFYDGLRNQLPPGVAADPAINGPTISAGQNIGNVTLTNGSIFEATIWATHAIGFLSITGGIGGDGQTPGTSSFIAAGDSIWSIAIAGTVTDTLFLVGLTSVGTDNRPGGVGAAADTVKAGWINSITIGGATTNVKVSAGMTAGDDGVYNTGDERVVPGVSWVDTFIVSGAISSTSVFFNSHVTTISPGVFVTGDSFALADAEVDPGSANRLSTYMPIGPGGLDFTIGGDSGTAVFSGPGSAFFDATTNRIVLINTSLDSSLVITSNTGRFTGLKIVTNDDASIGTLDVRADLFGESDIVIDAYAGSVRVGNFFGRSVRIGGDSVSFTSGAFVGQLQAAHVATTLISGVFGVVGDPTSAKVDMLSGGTFTITGTTNGRIDVMRDLSSFSSGGAMGRSAFRSGGSLGSFTVGGALTETFVSVNNTLGSATINGDMTESSLLVGGDLGPDAVPGGGDDAVSTGFLGNVTINGNFARSSIAAGSLRGPDSFLGTADDLIADGRSTTGSITITGTQVGSPLNSQSYRISSTGTLGQVTIGGQPASPSSGNFAVGVLPTQPLPIRVQDLQVTQDSHVYIAKLIFNQPINASTISPALTVSEVRSGGAVLIRLVEGQDYSVAYDPATNTAVVTFDRTVTERALPQTAGVPGPGVYRFDLDPNILRAQVVGARLDGNGDGFATPGDLYSDDNIVGDAGDKISPEQVTVNDGQGNPHVINFYGATDLDVVLDNNHNPDGLPDPNRTFTLRGAIGDHPNNDTDVFRFAGDVDLYKVTLQAGQIVHMAPMSGGARLALREILDPTGTPVTEATLETLPVNVPGENDLTFENNYLVKQTGTYYILVGNTDQVGPGVVNNLGPVPGGIGDYQFALQIFDDGDSGFNGPTDASNGVNIVNAPLPTDFAGPDGAFGTPDDPGVINIGGFPFTLNPGPDGVRGTADDVVSASNGFGITSTRASNQFTTDIDAAIGPAHHAGLPGDVFPDVDIFHLNNHAVIAPGTLIKITVKLTNQGADLGSRISTQRVRQDFSGSVQFGVFDTTDATNIDDALLVFSPTDFKPTGGTPGVTATNGSTQYGYDSNGDFFIQFVTPGKLGSATPTPASYAVYLQGVFNTDYSMQIVQQVAPGNVQPGRTQNIFIETRGGTVNWLEAGGLTTTLTPFKSSTLGFTGSVNNQPVDTYILTNLVNQLRAVFAAGGWNVNISLNPGDFEQQDFSTVFLSSTVDPVNFFNDRIFGYSQHSDPFNTDRNDQAVVFVPSFSILNDTPSTADVNLFTQSLTAAVGRRVGELMGLRVEAPAGINTSPVSIMASDSVQLPPGPGGIYQFSTLDRALSPGFDTLDDTNFFLGRQNARSLLDKILTHP
jgi:hypothetical protein